MWITENIKPTITRPIYYWVGIVILASLGLAIAGEFDTMLAWWLSIVLLLPPLLWALKTPYVSLKTICGISFLTQFVTLPFFYLYSANFAWGHVKPFHFTAWEAFPMLSKVSLFLIALILFFKWLYPISLFGGSSRKLTNSNSQITATKDRLNKYSDFDVRYNRKPWLFTLLIILLIAVLTPLNFWSYSKGIGLTGVEPPKLPYRLSGILFYLTKYITPLFLGYLYLKTKRGWPLMMLFLVYAWILGFCSVSKGAVLIVMFPVLALALVDKRKRMLVVASLGTVIGVSFADSARAYVHIVTFGKTGADTSLSIFTLIADMFTDPNNKMWNFDFIPLLVNSILARIEGFGNLVMAQYYDPDAVNGAWGFILRMIWRGLSTFDVDLHHIQWQGNILPIGFYNGGSLLSTIVIVGNAGLWWVVISALVTTLILVILEKSTKRLFSIYKLPKNISYVIIAFFCVLYFTESGGSQIFVYPLLLIFITSLLLPIFRLKGNR